MPTKYISRKDYATLKGRLTRAQKKGPGAVVREVRHAIEVFNDHVWPDDWHRWNCALSDCHRSMTFFDMDQLESMDDAGVDALVSRLEDTDTCPDCRPTWRCKHHTLP